MSPEPTDGQGLQAPEVNAERPWLGLLPYKEQHRDFFFGRDREIEDIFGRIRDNSLTILYGQSGLGKSSLLAAGVLPRLREAGYAPAIIGRCFNEGSERLTLLEQTRSALPLSSSAQLADRATPSLWELFHQRAFLGGDTQPQDSGQKSPIPVLIFDQFEEIFTLGALPHFETEVSEWLEQMVDLLQNRPPRALAVRFAQAPALAKQYQFGDAHVRIVFTLREDYLAHLERWKARLPLLMQNRMALTLLTGPQARQAVLGPAQLGDHSLVSREVAEMIVRRVVHNARDDSETDSEISDDTPLEQIKAVPPFLSLLCEQLNAARISVDESRITTDSVRNQAKKILQRFYEDSFLAFPEEHRSLIRCLLEDPPMITGAGHRNAIVRDDAEAQLTNAGLSKTEAKAIFDSLIQRRLITAETRDHVQRLEITHDVLVPLLLRSRKERHDREAIEFRQRALSAKVEQDRLDRERRRLRRTIAAMTALALIATCFAVYGWMQARLARAAEITAKEAESKIILAHRIAIASAREAEEARSSALEAADQEKAANENYLRILREGSTADYATAIQRIEIDNRWLQGLAHLARSLKWDPKNSQSAARLYSTLAFHSAERQSWPYLTMRHDSRVLAAQFSPDGKHIVTASADKTARVWEAASGKPLGGPLYHDDRVWSAQFSPDGKHIVTASADKTARVWDSASGKPVGGPLYHDDRVWSAQFSPDGKHIVTASADKTARVWEAASGKPVGEPLRHEDSVWSAQFSPDGTHIVTASWDHTARVWEATSGRPVGKSLRHENRVLSAQFSPDGKHIVTASEDYTAQLWDAFSGKPMGEPMRHEDSVWSAQFSPDGTRIVTASADKTARVWEATTGKWLGKSMKHEDRVYSVQFSPDGARITTASADNTAHVWDATSGKPMGVPLCHEGRVWSAQFSPDGTRIVTASEDDTARVWEAASSRPMGEPLRHDDRVRSAQFSPDGTRIVTGSGRFLSQKGEARVWDTASGKLLGEPLRHTGSVNSAQFSPDGTRIVTASEDYTARVWDLASGSPLGEPLRHQAGVLSAQFSPDGTRIVTASLDNTARVWEVASGKPVGEPLRHEDGVYSAQFSADGTRIVTASLDKTVRVWGVVSGKVIGKPLIHESRVLSAHFSPDDTRIVTASEDKTARMWDAVSGKSLGEPLRHAGRVNSARFSPDGTRIVTASEDNTARVWDVASGKPVGEPLRHEDSVYSAHFSADGTRIVTASEDQTARVWDVTYLVHALVPLPNWMLQRAYAVAGLDFDADGQMQTIPEGPRRQVLLDTPPADANYMWSKVVRWLALPADKRSLTPDSKFTCRQIAERERDSGLREGFESALRYDPSVPLAHLLLAKFEDDPSRAAFLRNFEMKRLPDDATLWHRASRALLSQKQPATALEAARKAIAIDPSLIDAHRALAYALAAAGSQVEALHAWDKVLGFKEASFYDFCDAGLLAAELSRGDKSRAIFREAEERFPTIPRVLRFKGQSLLLLREPAEALAALQAYESKLAAYDGSKPPQNAIAMLSVGRWLTGDKNGAISDYQRLIGMVAGYANVDEITKGNWPDAIKKPMLELLTETLKRHPELVPKPEPENK